MLARRAHSSDPRVWILTILVVKLEETQPASAEPLARSIRKQAVSTRGTPPRFSSRTRYYRQLIPRPGSTLLSSYS